jgi:hypothetical protein
MPCSRRAGGDAEACALEHESRACSISRKARSPPALRARGKSALRNPHTRLAELSWSGE